MSNLKIFHSNIFDGNMSFNKKMYPRYMSDEEIKIEFMEKRIEFGNKAGIDGLSIIIPRKNYTNKYKNHILTYEDIKNKGDLFDLDITCDSMMMDKKSAGISIAYPVSDFPVVILEDRQNNVAVVTYCDHSCINKNYISKMVRELKKETNCSSEDIIAYIGPHAKKESFLFDQIPSFVKNESAWEGSIEYKDEKYTVDIEKAITKEFEQEGIRPILTVVSGIDTITSPLYYSTYKSTDKNKKGKFLTGCSFDYRKSLTK